VAYPQPGDVNVRGTVISAFKVTGGRVEARWQDWELPSADDFEYFYQSPLVFEYIESGFNEGDSVTFDVVAGPYAACATNLSR
jgi:hypothetical protein